LGSLIFNQSGLRIGLLDLSGIVIFLMGQKYFFYRYLLPAVHAFSQGWLAGKDIFVLLMDQ
jgi:hypothetical protein